MKTTAILTAALMAAWTPAAADEADDWFNGTTAGDADTVAAAPVAAGRGGGVPEVFAPADYVYTNVYTGSAPYHTGKAGILIVGEPGKARAVQPFSWSNESVRRYAVLANRLAKEFGDGVQVYCMPIPIAAAFYTPDAARSTSRPQDEGIRTMLGYLDPGVKGVNVFPILGEHAGENIYSRTDHHWAPLGAYYAASQLAAAAGVPYLDLADYDRHEIEGYVGTMYKYSGDPAIKSSPETFVYYTPRGVDYKTTYVTYTTKGLTVTGESGPKEGEFFLPFKGVSSYCTFMGGDTKITKVETSTRNGRRLLIIKDSFGNALPGYLFGSFEEVHVVDCRYFTKNLKKYVKENGITDVVLANNIGHAISERTCSTILKYLEQ